jgi:hypothetical protein
MTADYYALQIGTVNYMSPEAVHKMKGQSVYKVRFFLLCYEETYTNHLVLPAFIPERCLVLRVYTVSNDLR